MADLAIAKIISFHEGKSIIFDVCTMAGHRDQHVKINLVGPKAPEGLDHLVAYKVGYIYTVLAERGYRRRTSGIDPLTITKIQGTARVRNWKNLTGDKGVISRSKRYRRQPVLVDQDRRPWQDYGCDPGHP